MREPGAARGFDRNYKRGAVMGLTVAEAFILLAFCLLLLFSWWQVETERKSLVAADEIAHLTDAQKAEIVAGLSDGTFQMANTLRHEMTRAGLPVAGPEAVADAKAFSRFMSEQDLKRLMQGAAELPPETRLRLADTVEVGDARRLAQAMDRIEAETPVEDPTQRISQRLAQADAAERQLVETLQDRLGGTIRAAGGSIGADGAISLPQSVLFEVNDDKVKNPAFLRDFCAPWLQTLRQSGVDISELKIEGHASSEGPPGASPERAYLYNLDLSQRRAQNARRVCLNADENAPVQAWARDHLTAVGYSSNRLIRDPDGAENRDASRRVMFSAAVDRNCTSSRWARAPTAWR
jgi:outer membrane protein OmpA-like peptidoglycan-associated protein